MYSTSFLPSMFAQTWHILDSYRPSALVACDIFRQCTWCTCDLDNKVAPVVTIGTVSQIMFQSHVPSCSVPLSKCCTQLRSIGEDYVTSIFLYALTNLTHNVPLSYLSIIVTVDHMSLSCITSLRTWDTYWVLVHVTLTIGRSSCWLCVFALLELVVSIGPTNPFYLFLALYSYVLSECPPLILFRPFSVCCRLRPRRRSAWCVVIYRTTLQLPLLFLFSTNGCIYFTEENS